MFGRDCYKGNRREVDFGSQGKYGTIMATLSGMHKMMYRWRGWEEMVKDRLVSSDLLLSKASPFFEKIEMCPGCSRRMLTSYLH